MRLLILLIWISIISISSCTIQKRTFRNGYYISWNKSAPKEKSGSKTDEVTEIEKEELTGSPIAKDTTHLKEQPITTKDLALVEQTDTLEINEPLSERQDSAEIKSSDKYSEETLLKHLGEAVESMKDPKLYQIEEETSGKRLNLFSLNSLVFSIGYVILLFASLNIGGPSVTLAIAGIVICAILAIVFAIIGLVKWGRNRDGFWGTFFSIIALGLLVVGLFAFLLFVIASMSFG